MNGESSSSRLFTFRDLAEILWLPLAIGLIAAAATWVIWYYTAAPCSPEAAALYHCNPSRIARYVNVDIWARCLTLGTLTGGLIGGGVNYAMFSRERAARIAAEIIAEEERKRADEERKRVDEERKLREEDRKRIDQLVEQLSENGRQTAEMQRQAAENQRQASEAQQAMLTAITALTVEVTELRRQRNGENGAH